MAAYQWRGNMAYRSEATRLVSEKISVAWRSGIEMTYVDISVDIHRIERRSVKSERKHIAVSVAWRIEEGEK